MIKIGNTEYTTLDDLENDPTLLTEEDKKQIDIEVTRIEKRIKARELKEKLIKTRESMGLTQKEFAYKVGIKQSTIAKLEKTGITPQIDRLYKLLSLLGYTIEIVPREKLNQ